MKGNEIMGIAIGNYNFGGPFPNTGSLYGQSGVYAILGRRNPQEQWTVLDIGESGDVKNRVECHDRADSWKRQGQTELAVAAHYCDERMRMKIEQELRALYNPPCGDR